MRMLPNIAHDILNCAASCAPLRVEAHSLCVYTSIFISLSKRCILGHLQSARLALADMPLDYQMMLHGAADPHSVTQHGVYRRGLPGEPLQLWGRGRVTFVGDATVPIRPATGAGSWCTWTH